VLTWAPHPRPLPQAVPNSFAEWMNAAGYEFVITIPKDMSLMNSLWATPLWSMIKRKLTGMLILSMPKLVGRPGAELW